MIKEDFGMENIKVKDRFVDEKTGIEYIKKGGSSISTLLAMNILLKILKLEYIIILQK